MSEHPPRTARQRLLFALWVVVASLLLLEGVLQVAALFVKPERQTGDLDPGAVRVLAVGDSWVDGAEAPDGEGFVDHLGRELAEAAGQPVQVVNLGRTGANSAHAALTVLDEAPAIEPRLVLVLVGQNNASNFYRVAEVEQRLGGAAGWGLAERIKLVKLARILVANAAGGSGYDDAALPEIPAIERDDQGRDLSRDPWLTQGLGLAYLRREFGRESLTSPAQAPWAVLHATAQRDLAAAAKLAWDAVQAAGWPTTDTSPSAPTASSEEEALLRYALLRLAREERNWRSVRYHGGALLEYAPRNALTDLGAAEAALLAGDWRRARALLVSAHHRAPGLPDAIDLAGRFPPHARDPELLEVLEYPPAGRLLDYERARMLRSALQPDAAEAAALAWIGAHPDDLILRVDLARQLLADGRLDDALLAAGLEEIVSPDDPTSPLWRLHIAAAGETGDRDTARAAVDAALAASDTPGPDLLGIASKTLAAYGFCDEAVEVSDRWFLARGDANGYSRHLDPCLSAGDAAARLERLRASWAPLGSQEAFTALVRAGHKPFELLYRDLDLIDTEARKTGGRLLLVNYPNPSEDHTALRAILGEYAGTRGVPYVDLWARFDGKYDRATWATLLGPNGHCNAAGYREMADGILEYVRTEGLLAP